MSLLPGILYGEKIPWSKILNFAGGVLKEFYIVMWLCSVTGLDENNLHFGKKLQWINVQHVPLWFICYMVQMYHKLREKLYWFIYTQHSVGCHHKHENMVVHCCIFEHTVHTDYQHMCMWHTWCIGNIVKAVQSEKWGKDLWKIGPSQAKSVETELKLKISYG